MISQLSSLNNKNPFAPQLLRNVVMFNGFGLFFGWLSEVGHWSMTVGGWVWAMSPLKAHISSPSPRLQTSPPQLVTRVGIGFFWYISEQKGWRKPTLDWEPPSNINNVQNHAEINSFIRTWKCCCFPCQ